MLHFITFNVPFPANYGGVIDVFYKIKALHGLGVKIILHCFDYGRGAAVELEKYCEQVFYYPRQTGVFRQFSTLPYIVNTRQSTELLQNLLKDNAPILFEGLHCCFYLGHPLLRERQKIVRMHNIEWEYYQHLANLERNFIKKLFFKIESLRLRTFQRQLKHATHIIAISKEDQEKLGREFKNVDFVPAFHHCEQVNSRVGKGDYVLFHGDLSVKDNEAGALFLIKKVFATLKIPFIVAGLHPSARLKAAIAEHKHIELQANLPHETLQTLIENAQINVLISFQSAGMKLKLLNAVFNGRFCIVNPPIVANTGLEAFCEVLETPSEIQTAIQKQMPFAFSAAALANRQAVFEAYFSNIKNAETIAQLLH